MYTDNFKKNPFFFHMAYFCRARNDSHEITRDMLKCNTQHTTVVPATAGPLGERPPALAGHFCDVPTTLPC